MCSSSHEKIMEMECKLLTSNFKDTKTIGLMKENFGRISNGSSSHCAGALKLGFKNAFELKKQASELKKQARELEQRALGVEKQILERVKQALEEQKKNAPGVLLRCNRYGCPSNTTPVSYSTVGSQIYCPNCQRSGYGQYNMQCTGCSYNRTVGNVSCQSCGKNFS